MRRLLLIIAVAVSVSLSAGEAFAGRKIRLTYEVPASAAALSGGTVGVVFEDAREEKKGGKEP
jgi:hypothetical protein